MEPGKYYMFHRGGWRIGVDAVSLRDAQQHIKRRAPGDVYDGYFAPTINYAESATGMVTYKKQAIYHVQLMRLLEGENE